MTHRVAFEGRTFEVAPGTRLRDALLKQCVSPHNGQSRWFNCKGFGTCGTCAVRIEGPIEPPSPREQARLRFAPHRIDAGLRLACQVRVEGDLRVTKYQGFWGQDTSAERGADG